MAHRGDCSLRSKKLGGGGNTICPFVKKIMFAGCEEWIFKHHQLLEEQKRAAKSKTIPPPTSVSTISMVASRMGVKVEMSPSRLPPATASKPDAECYSLSRYASSKRKEESGGGRILWSNKAHIHFPTICKRNQAEKNP